MWAVVVALLAIIIVAGIFAVGDPSATGALLVPLAFCIGGLVYFYRRRAVRFRIRGTTFEFSRWWARKPIAAGLTKDVNVSRQPVPTMGELVEVTHEGSRLLYIYPATSSEARMLEAAFVV